MKNKDLPDYAARSVSYQSVKEIEGFVGQLMIGHAFLDQAFDFWLMHVFSLAVANNLTNKKMPFETGRKMALLEKCFQRIRELEEFRDEALSLIAEAKTFVSDRNILAHGALSHFQETPEKAMVFCKLRYNEQRGVHILTDHELTFARIAQLAESVMNLVHKMHAVTGRIVAKLP
jgi:hypothetical protein